MNYITDKNNTITYVEDEVADISYNRFMGYTFLTMKKYSIYL